MNSYRRGRRVLAACLLVLKASLLTGAVSVLAVCGPFTDFTDAQFCPFVLAIFYSGITTGDDPTTFDPTANVSRLQMAAFLSPHRGRGPQEGKPARVSPAELDDEGPVGLRADDARQRPPRDSSKSDGEDLWVSHAGAPSLECTRATAASSGAWTGASSGQAVLSGDGRIFVAGATTWAGSTGSIRAPLPAPSRPRPPASARPAAASRSTGSASGPPTTARATPAARSRSSPWARRSPGP